MEPVQRPMVYKTEAVTRLYNHSTEDYLMPGVRGILGGML